MNTWPDARAGRRARAWLAYAALRLGRTGQAGVVLLLLAGLAWGGALKLQGERASLQHQLAQAESQARWRQSLATARPPRQVAPTLQAQLPGVDDVPTFVEGLHREATRGGVAIERAEYRPPVRSAAQVMRSQVVLPLTGTYVAIGRWLALVLHEHPSAALDEITLQRDPAGAALRARVVLSHYSKVAP